MLSKLKFAPFILLIAFVALYRPASPVAAPLPVPARATLASWEPAIAPTVSFSAPSADADTSGAFSITLAFDDAGGDAIAPSSLQLMASRSVTVASAAYAAGENLADISGFMESLTTSGASVAVDQTSSGILFDNGEYVLSARVKNTGGRWSNWVTRRFYIEGTSAAVVKAASALKHGDADVNITLTGSGLSTITEADFGADITVSALSASSTSVTATVTVAEGAAAGPRVVTLGGGVTTFVASPQASGIVNITYPTDQLPLGGAAEARRNATVAGRGIVLKNGAFTWLECDLSIAGIGLNLDWSRAYRSDVDFDGPMGRNWHAFYFQRVIYDGGLKWYTGEGRLEAFSAVSGGFVAPAGLYVKAERDSGTGIVTLTDRHGGKLIFDAQGRLAFIVDINSNRIECEYNFIGQLFRIIDSRGERVRLIYGADGRVETLRDKAWSDTTPRTVKYGYNAGGELSHHKAPETAQYFDTTRLTREYHYDSAHRMTRIVNPREHAGSGANFLENDYSGGKISAQRIGGSGNWSYIRYPANKQRRVIDPRGLRTDYDLNNVGAALTITRYTAFWSVDTGSPPNQTTITQTASKLRSTDPTSFIDDYAYNMATEMTRHTLPRGNKVKFEFPDPTQTTSGTSTAIGTTLLTDSAAAWTTNQHAGRWLQVGADVSEYRYYVIVSNTATVLTLSAFEDLTADGFSTGATYAIFTANPDPLAAGNCLTVTREDGPVGSLSNIVTSTTYESRFQFPKTQTEARGHVTTFTYGYEVSGTGDVNECNLVSEQSPSVSLGQPSAQSIVTAYEYDSRGRLILTTDAAGIVTEYSYFTSGDAEGYLQKIVRDPSGLAITYEYDRNSVGQIIGIWPPRAHEIGADKDSHKLTYEINELGQTTHTAGPVLFETGSARADEYFIYDENGNLTSQLKEYVTAAGEEPDAPTDPFDPASFPRATAPMAATWIETSYTYNSRNQIDSRTEDVASGSTLTRATWSLAYDGSFNAATLTSPEGRVSVRAFDERNLQFTLTFAPSTAIEAQWRTDYDANGNATRLLDARGYAWLAEFDGFERKTRNADPLGNYVKFGFDAASNPTQREFFNASNTLLARDNSDFDEANRLYRTRRLAKDHAGANIGDGENTTTLLLDALGRKVASTDEFNRVTQFTYDNGNRVSLIIDAALNELEYGYDAAGAVVSRTQNDYDSVADAYVTSSAEADLDRRGNVLRLRDRRYSTTLDTEAAFSYDGLSQLVNARQGGHTLSSEYRYDLRGLLTGATFKPVDAEALWVVTASCYDDDGLLISRSVLEDPAASSPVEQLTQFTLDVRGRVTGTTLPSSAAWTFTYDACDNAASRTDPAGTLATFTNDARGLCTLAAITRGSGVLGSTQESWSYDGLGRVTLAATVEGSQTLSSETFVYNTLSLCESSAESLWRQDGQSLGTFTSAREFDATGFCTANVFANARRITYGSDSLNRIATVNEGSSVLAAYDYVGARIKGITWSNGTASAFSYDADLVQGASLTRGGETLFGTEARYDVSANLMAQRFAHEGNQGDVFRYDDMPSAPDGFSAPKPAGTWHPADDFSAPKPAGTWHPADDFSAPKPAGTWHPADDFSAPKPAGTWHPADDFSAPKPAGTWHPADDFSVPAGPRLVATYSGVDLADEETFEDLPTAFALARDYALDTRSSRVFTLDRDETSATVHETAYVTGDDNRYTSVNGESVSYDAAGRISYDAATGLHYAYDWLGRVVAEDVESDFAHPEKLIAYDARGRRVWEQSFYTTGSTVRYATRALLYDDREFANTELALNDSATVLGQTQFTAGPAPASWRDVMPERNLEGDGRTLFREAIVHELATYGAQSQPRFRCEDVQGRLMGVCDENGLRLAEYSYTDFGAPLIRNVLFERGGLTVVAEADTPAAGQTTITLSASALTLHALKGRELCVSLPGAASDRYRIATVLDNGTSSIVVDDPEGRICDALLSVGFVVFDFNDAAVGGGIGTGGRWSSDGTFSSGQTAFTQSGQSFGDVAGWLVALNAERGGTLAATSASGASLLLEGDARGLAHDGNRYRVYTPACVSPTSGALELNLVQQGTRCFSGTTRYEGPLAGFFDGVNVLGAQGGHSRRGGALIGARQFDVSWGRYREPGGAWLNRYQR